MPSEATRHYPDLPTLSRTTTELVRVIAELKRLVTALDLRVKELEETVDVREIF